MGVAADAKNLAAIFRDFAMSGGPQSRSSYGVTEIQIRHAMEYGVEKGLISADSISPNLEAYSILLAPDASIDMAAWLAAKNQSDMGIVFKGNEAGYAHNLGIDLYSKYRNGESVDVSIPQRSDKFQIAIGKALNQGVVAPFEDFFYQNPHLCGGCSLP